MGVIGKIIGGTLGFAMGGPLGAIAGAALGHAFVDSADDGAGGLRVEAQAGRPTLEETAELTFFVAAFSMLAKLVKADGRITREEIAAIEHFMSADLNLTPRSRQVAMDIFNTALEAPQGFEAFAAQFHDQFRHQPQLLDLMLDILLRVSVADGAMGRYEDAMVQAAARIFGFSDSQYADLRRRYLRTPGMELNAELARHYAVLNCRPEDPDEQVKRQYRKLVQDFHPDKIAAKGLPEEFTKFAQEKFQQIQQAYEAVKKARGMV
jgi:DnaJ like chaperone protein